MAHAHLVSEDAGHGRIETCRYWTTIDAELLAYLNPDGQSWPDLRCVGMVERADGRGPHQPRDELLPE